MALNQTLLLQKYRGTSVDIFYGLKLMAPTKQKNKQNVSLEIFKTSVCFLSMTVKPGVANNRINYHINKE